VIAPEEINIKFISHLEQRYESHGDYGIEDGKWWFTISKTEDPRHALLVLFHEIAELILVQHHGVPLEAIDHFDMEGEGKDHPDPGTLPSAPYFLEHAVATDLERQMATYLDVDWKAYNAALDAMEYNP
jgi:hypothetical protein